MIFLSIGNGETLYIQGGITWEDFGNFDGIRPESMNVSVLADNQTVQTITMDASSDWKWKSKDLPRYRNHGTEIEYKYTASYVPGYEFTVYPAENKTVYKHTPKITVKWFDELIDPVKEEVYDYLFWADDLAEAVGKSVPYKSAGNIFVDVPEEYKEEITGELVEAVSPYFSNQSFSISERGNTTVPAKFGGYRLIYSTSGETVYEKVNGLGIIQNVPVHFVRAGNVKYTEMGIVEGSIVLSPEKAFSSKQEAVEAMERKKGYADAKVYKAENYSFEYEDNSIVSLSGAAVKLFHIVKAKASVSSKVSFLTKIVFLWIIHGVQNLKP